MTATKTPPVSPQHAPPTPQASSRQRPGIGSIPGLVAEILITVIGLTLVFGFGRVFEDGAYTRPLLISALASHALAVLGRRLGVSIGVSALMSTAGLLLSQSLLHYRSTTRFGLPTSDTRDQVRTDLVEAWELFGNVSAPVEPLTGFVIASAVGLWLVMFLADWAAFRMRSGFEALLPPAVIFIFVSLFAAEQRRLMSTALFAGAALAFIVTHRAWVAERSGTSWLGGTPKRGTQALLTAGSALAAMSLIFGMVAGPRLPGAGEEPVIDLEKVGDGPGTRVAVNPLVGIQSQLVDLPNTVVFTVRADQRTYWKLTSLPVFDGRQFTANQSFSEVDGELESRSPRVGSVDLDQEFTIAGLAGEWLPAAHEPKTAAGEDFPINWNADISSLILKEDRSVEPGMKYTVTSGIIPPDINTIRNAQVPEDVDDVFLDLPDDFSENAQQIAREVTAAATSPYEQALLLQDFFRDQFRYDINVANGHDITRIDDFLTARVGYCEQFSTAYAALARSLGLPTRVSVGFTGGDYSPEEDLYRVKGDDAHAWPEVFFEDIGWLRFEPTPGRGADGDEVYTGRTSEPTVENPAETPTTTPSTTVAPAPEPTVPDDQQTPADREPGQAADPVPVASGESGRGFYVPPQVLFGLLGFFGLAALIIGSILTAKKRKRSKLLAVHQDENRRQIAEAWLLAQDTLTMSGIPPMAAETPTEYSERVALAVRDVRESMTTLANRVTSARFSAKSPSDADVAAAKGAAAQIAQQLDNELTWIDRSKHALDLRSLLPESSSIDG